MSPVDLLRSLTGRSAGSTLEAAAAEATAGWIGAVGLDAYPSDPERVARVREAVLLAHRRQLALATADRGGVRGFRLGTGLARRAGALALGLTLMTVGGVSAAAGSAPGGPLYETRLAIETLTLPSADTAEGVEARLDQLDERLAEASLAASKSDGSAVSAALRAYRASLAALFPADRPGGGRGASAGSPGDVADVVHSVLALRGIDEKKVRERLQHASLVLLSIPGVDLSTGSAAEATLIIVRHLHSVIAAGLTRGDDEWHTPPGADTSASAPGKGKGNGKGKGLDKSRPKKPVSRPVSPGNGNDDRSQRPVPNSRPTAPPGSSRE